MLDTIRNAVNSWVAKVFLGILVLCFVLLWGVPELRKSGGNDLFIAGKSSIKTDTYRLALGDQTMRYSLAINSSHLLSPGEAQQYGIPQAVLGELQKDVIFDEQARLMKIGVSKDGIASAIGRDTIFYQQGSFNRTLFMDYLKQLRINESDLIEYYASKEKRDQFLGAAIGGLKTPDVFLSALQNYQGETRSADYIVVTPKEIGTLKSPSQDDLQKWFDQHKEQFRAPEYRKVTLMVMSPEQLVKPDDISDDEAKAYYTQNASHYIAPEKRTVEELRFATREEADAAHKKLENGMTFDDLVKSQKKTLDEIKKGPLAKNEFPVTVASDIFNLANNAVSDVINDLQGPVIIRLVDVQPSQPLPFEKVEKDIRLTLAKTNAAKAMRDNHDAIENARFEGVSLQDLSNQYKLPLREVTLDDKGSTQDGNLLTDLPQQNILLDAIFQATEGADMDPISLQGGGYLWYRLDSVIPARDRTLEEVKDKVTNGWKSDEIQYRLNEEAKKLEGELKNGKTLDALAKELGVTKHTARGLKRGNSAEVIGSEGVAAVFAGPKGHKGTAKGALSDNRIIYEVTESVEPLNTDAKSLSSEQRKNFDLMMGADLKTELLLVGNEQTPVKADNINYNQILQNLQ